MVATLFIYLLITFYKRMWVKDTHNIQTDNDNKPNIVNKIFGFEEVGKNEFSTEYTSFIAEALNNQSDW